ncbi:MAG: ferritin-like domain-containing protein [Candidatus Micrarchaeota archaeon]|nr:ferritin-like domain-containing protein [Candidatus Micrarchaeota archaeon]
MGTKAKEIVKMDARQIVEMLNKALADEWLAYYQYWVGALVVRGPMRPEVQKELAEHAEEEFKHANMLAERIIQLGGTPILNPADWMKKSSCGYDEPKDEHVLKIIGQNIKGEQCAIEVYSGILEKLKNGGDHITFNMIRKILEDEVEHEQELQDLEQDIKMI